MHSNLFCFLVEPWTICDISQWTDRNSIALDSTLAPSASMNLPLAISTRSLLSSPKVGPHRLCWTGHWNRHL